MSFATPSLGIKSFFPSNLTFKKKTKSTLLHASGIVVGRFQILKSLNHSNLAPYYDILRRKQERLFVVSETFDRTLQHELEQSLTPFSEDAVRRIIFQILDVLLYLESHGIYHGNISMKNIYINSQYNIKLSDYGIQHITRYGKIVNFVIGDPHYMPPERIADGISNSYALKNSKVDVWSLGILALELALCRKIFSDTDALTTFLEILQFIGHDLDIEEEKRNAHGTSLPCALNYTCKLTPLNRVKQHEQLKKTHKLPTYLAEITYSSTFKEILEFCLETDPVQRISLIDLIQHPYFEDLYVASKANQLWMVAPGIWAPLLDRNENDPWRQFVEEKTQKEIQKESGLTTHLFRTPKKKRRDLFDPKDTLNLKELYFIWKSTSLNVETDLAPSLKMTPPILRIPLFVVSSTFEVLESQSVFYKDGILDESRLYTSEELKITLADLTTLLAQRSERLRQDMEQTHTMNWSPEQKEFDLDYQHIRIKIFKALLPELPESRFHISKEAQKDIPPILRGDIWAAILEVPSTAECRRIYDRIDKDSIGPADKQIDLDIPRCHQYHELLSSEEGHIKFKRILKAWVQHNPKLGYWQGIDSLLAPFLCLHFNEEAKAFMCLQKIIEKFSKNLFDKDNSVYLQEHLHILKQILSYHDPELAMHLHQIGFHPNLYAIPWFITLFTHLFSMDQIYRLWDKLLMSNSQLPFFIAYSMLKNLKEILLPLDFNSCILLFSSLPSVNIDEVIKEAQDVFRTTPESVTIAKYIMIDHEVCCSMDLSLRPL